MSMYCYQCQEASKGVACQSVGVCGKDSNVSNLQDLFIFTLKGLAAVNEQLNKKNQISEKIDKYIWEGLFLTITNANFDEDVFISKIKENLFFGSV